MKKTVSVNIKGINFLIEEDAYEKLQDYLTRLEISLKHQEGAEDIIEDIELRIAELCSKRLNENKEVIEFDDIQQILETLGEPEQFVDEDEESERGYQNSESSNKGTEKRLFRDTENAQIAGVCAGIANFFGIDVLIVRLAWVFMFLFAGAGVLLYIILWVIVPKAESTIDRLRMKGRPITVESVREEVERAAENVKTGSKRFINNIKNEDSYSRRMSTIGRVISVLIGLFFFGMALTFLISFIVLIVGGLQFIPAQTDQGMLSLTQLGELLLPSSGDVSLAWTGGLMFAISALSFLFLLSSILIFRIRTTWTKYLLGLLFVLAVIGGVIGAYVGMKTGRDFVTEGELQTTIGSVETEQLVITPQLSDYLNIENYKVTVDNDFSIVTLHEDELYISNIRFTYRNSADSSFHVYQKFSAHAHALPNALNKAKNIKHDAVLVNDTLLVDTEFRFPKEDKIRDQDVDIIIEIPSGKSVKIGSDIIRLGETENEDEEHQENFHERGRLRSDGSYRHWY